MGLDGGENLFIMGEITKPITWNLDNAGTLTIYGEGEIPRHAEWCEQKEMIKNIVIKTGITSIENAAFLDYKHLISIAIPNSVKCIGSAAFSGCTSLISITIPDSITIIADFVFSKCKSLRAIIIPTYVTNIGTSAFALCEKLDSITIYNTVPLDIDSSVFEYVNKNFCTLKVPMDSISDYQNADVWKEFNVLGI